MLVDFKDLPDTSRIWIYQANRSLTPEELAEIKEGLDAFIVDWIAHGSNLTAGYEIKYKRFIVLGLDQTNASATGCSIDASVRFIQSLEQKYNIDLLDKMNVSYKQGEFVAYKTLVDFKKMAKNKSVSKKTIVFNNLVANKHEYLNYWEVPAEESWHSRFM
ncbi:PIN domain-containing protein [Cellulophaga omnivescoria]|uniref:ABC transporter ATPase n=1 Tax=Cellulophaga omnivescoria TaxID=1888890 RepID=UPI0022F00E07|nr:ABC transporter ATPase [Cellulophaga omnivescoria]WBU88790.1 ABC transporter ATPase [Cellulophaga omnivescoria]